MKSLSTTMVACLVLGAMSLTGCQTKTADNDKSSKSNYDGAKFVLSAEPEGVLEVIAARETIKDTDEVVIVGRIGGSSEPWVKGCAAFNLVDTSLLACGDENEEGEVCSCPTPWDYCCETDKLPNSMALVQFVESDGTIVKHDAREVFNLKELQTVVIKGTAKRVEGNLTILATGMYVRK